MKKVVLITGANGMLGQRLAADLRPEFTIRFLSREARKADQFHWDIQSGIIDPEALTGVDHIIHLAGASVLEKRWSPERKEVIRESRVRSAELILRELQRKGQKIESFISASAVGYYGSRTDSEIWTESSPSGDDFLSSVCKDWEAVAREFEAKDLAQRSTVLRIGIILSERGGALPRMASPFKYGLGSALGSGLQWMTWIHIHDLSRIFKSSLINDVYRGVFNAVAPDYTTNARFSMKLSQTMKKRMVLPNIPAWLLRLLIGESSVLLLEGSRVSAEKLIGQGFHFDFPTLESALDDLLD